MQKKKVCTCKICGKEYEGYSSSCYCSPECHKVGNRDRVREYYAREKAKREEAKAKAAALDERRGWLSNPDRKQCVGCRYSAPLHCDSSGEHFCDYMKKHAEEAKKAAKEQGQLWDGIMERRKHDGNVCLSRVTK